MLETLSEIAVTLDLDWCSDCMIEAVSKSLQKEDIRATWFVTHDSEAVQRLLANPLFEIGIHPNFLACSTQGKTPLEVMEYLKGVVPGAKTARTHALFQSSIHSETMRRRFGVEVDSSIYLRDVPNIIPFETYYDGLPLVRLPFYWTEDGERNLPKPSFKVNTQKLQLPGLKVFAFHPIHICTSKDVRAFFLDLIHHLENAGLRTRTLYEIAKDWKCRQ